MGIPSEKNGSHSKPDFAEEKKLMNNNDEQLRKKFIKDLLKVFLIPTLINKTFMLYFGIQYAKYPDEGYGYGLCVTVFVLFFTMGRFLWRYRGIQDP